MNLVTKMVCYFVFTLIFLNQILSEPTTRNSQKSKRDLDDFSLSIFDVDWNKAYFEIVDDKKTTFNYDISYSLSSHDSINGDINFKSKLYIQTNPISLIEKEEKINQKNSFVPDQDKDPNGEFYNDWQIMNIRRKNYTDIHVFHINDLEPNRSYKILFKINCTRAHLSMSLLPNQDISTESSIKNFYFKFKTLFDPNLVKSITCNNLSNSDPKLMNLLSCYVEKSDCTACKPHCYKVPRYEQPILCWPCPCDQSRSNGICSVKREGNFEPEEIICEKCKPPYTGPLCDQCQNEGFDFYKNDVGECVKCNCNNNSYFDYYRIKNSSDLRKCNSNGFCHSCLYNTSGKHCEQCANGFEGDALKRTCRPIGKSTKIMINPTDDQHSSKNLALFAFYIFLVLFIILSFLVCLKIKLEAIPLKNDQNQCFIWFGNCCLVINRTRKRAYSYLENSRFFGIFNRFLNKSSGSNSNSMYSHTRLNDDDRLNLAEHPVFDDNLFDDAFVYNPKDDLDFNGNKNPYKSLTVKT